MFGATTQTDAVENRGQRRQVTPSAEVEDAVRRLTGGDVPGQGRLRRRSGHHDPVSGRDKGGDQRPACLGGRPPGTGRRTGMEHHVRLVTAQVPAERGARIGKGPADASSAPRSSAEKPAADARERLRSASWTSSSDVVPQIQQGPGIVLADRAEPAHPGHAQQQRQRQRRLVEGGEDQRHGRSPRRGSAAPAPPRRGDGRAAGRRPPRAPRTRAPQLHPAASGPPWPVPGPPAWSPRRRPRPHAPHHRSAGHHPCCPVGPAGPCHDVGSSWPSPSPSRARPETDPYGVAERGRDGGQQAGAIDLGHSGSPASGRGRPAHRRPAPRPRRHRCRRSPHTPSAARPSSRAAAWTRPGAGFRQAQPSSTPCGQTCQVSNGPSRSSTRALTRANASGLISPRATPDWLLTTPTATPRRRRSLSTRRAPGHRADARRVGQVGHVGDQGAVAVEQHGLRSLVRPGGAAPGRRTLHSPRSRW